MKGAVNEFREPILPLTVFSPTGEPFELDVLIDTGSTSELTLPGEVIEALELIHVDEEPATLANGEVIACRVFSVDVLWHSSLRRVRVVELNMDPLLGMKLLEGSRLEIDVRIGGEVRVNTISETEISGRS